MKWFLWFALVYQNFTRVWKRGSNQLFGFRKSPYFFLAVYLFLYGFHCLWNWDEFMILNHNLEMNAANSGKQVSLWSLYPFQIISVILCAVLYFLVCFGINFLFSFGKGAKEIFRTNVWDFFRNLIHQFFFFVCVLFLGNQFLGFFVNTNYYSTLVVMFWTALFLLFIIQNGKLYRRLFVSRDRSVLFISHSLGYVNPILFVFFVLALANV